MDKMRKAFVDEMARLKAAIEKTDSVYLKRDYQKAYNRMRAELHEYDSFKSGVKV